jgi:hypothetical protein
MKKGGGAVAHAAPIQDFAMLNVVHPGRSRNNSEPENLLSEANVSETRRCRAWLSDRLARGKSEVFSEVVSLSPELAEMLLDHNPNNRHIRIRAVQSYKTDIINGDWSLNGESLKVAKTGELNDGQHRCHAVIAAGRAVQTVIQFGLERETRMTVDQGAIRTTGNFLAMEGHKNANVAAAVASHIWQYENFGNVENAGHITPTKVQVKETYNRHPTIDDSIVAIPKAKHVGRSRSTLAFCHWLIARRTKTQADFFFLRLCLGDGLTRHDPIYHCRERLISDTRMTAAEKVELILRTWNASRKGRKATKCSPIIGELPKIEA